MKKHYANTKVLLLPSKVLSFSLPQDKARWHACHALPLLNNKCCKEECVGRGCTGKPQWVIHVANKTLRSPSQPGSCCNLKHFACPEQRCSECIKSRPEHHAWIQPPKQEHEIDWWHPGGQLLNATERPRQISQAKHAFAVHRVEATASLLNCSRFKKEICSCPSKVTLTVLCQEKGAFLCILEERSSSMPEATLDDMG